MTGPANAWDVDGVEVSPIQQRAVMRDLRRALVDPELDGVVLGRALHGDQWKEGFDSAVECVDARIEHLTGHIEGLADAVPPAPPSRRGLDALDVWGGSEAPGGWVCDVCRQPVESEPCREHQPNAYAEMRAEARATTPGDDRGRELAEIASRIDGVVQMLGNEFSPDGGRRRVLTAAAARLRALAAPAETEVGDDDLAELIGELRDDSENLGTLALNAEGEHNYHDAMLLRGIGMDCWGGPVSTDDRGRELPHDGESCEFADRENAALQARLSGLLDTPSAPAVVHDPDTEDEDGRFTEYPDLIDCHGARWAWAIGSEYRARHVLGGWKCRDVGYIRGVFGPVTEVPAAAPEGGPGSDRPWTSREVGDRNAADRMETWLREDKPSRVADQWTEDLERLIVAARHGRRQPAPLEGDLTEAMHRAGLCGEQYRTGDSVWLCTEPIGHRKGGCVDGEPPSLGEGAAETGDDPPDLIDGLGHRWWPGGIRYGRRYYMPWYRSTFDAAGALHRYQLVQPVHEVDRASRPPAPSGAGDEAASGGDVS